jgi:trans-aconitate methyltransferase
MGAFAKILKPWFGAGGDRTLAQQLTGLQALIQRVPGKTVMDVGCAEGLIGIHLYDAGAVAIHGIERRADYVAQANELRGDRACTFEVADADTFKPKREYDITLMLAVLHKLREPGEVLSRFALDTNELMVIRLPPEHAPCIFDARSRYRKINVDEVLKLNGFYRFLTTKGAYSEWVGYYSREMT